MVPIQKLALFQNSTMPLWHSRAYNCPGLSGTVPPVARGSRGVGAPRWELPPRETGPAAPLLHHGHGKGCQPKRQRGREGKGWVGSRGGKTWKGRRRKTTRLGRGERNNNRLMTLTTRTNTTARHFRTVPQPQVSCHFASLCWWRQEVLDSPKNTRPWFDSNPASKIHHITSILLQDTCRIIITLITFKLDRKNKFHKGLSFSFLRENFIITP